MTQPSSAWENYLADMAPELAALHEHPQEDVLPSPGRRPVSRADLLATLREQVKDSGYSGLRALRPDRRGGGFVAAAWRHTVFRQARAVLTLFDADLSSEAILNARSCLEHAVVLRRLALAADDNLLEPLLEAFAYEQQRRQGKHLDYLDDLDAATGSPNEALLRAARDLHDKRQLSKDTSRPEVRTTRDHFSAVPNSLHFYNVYNRLSENSHAGLGSAALYFTPSPSGELSVPAKPKPVPWAETLAVLVWACSDADDSMRRFWVDGEDIALRHIAIMAKVGLVPG